MKALTVWQPWASLIAIGAKPYEFRGWKPPSWLVGEQLAIHAGARPVRLSEVEELLARLDDECEPPCLHADKARPFLEVVLAGLKDKGAPLFGDEEPFTLPRSSIVCTVRVGEGKPGNLCAAEFGHGSNDSDREDTFNWGWPMLDIVPLMPPVEARGAQGLWNWGGA